MLSGGGLSRAVSNKKKESGLKGGNSKTVTPYPMNSLFSVVHGIFGCHFGGVRYYLETIWGSV